MDITRAAITRNRVTLVALVVIYIWGLQAYFTLPRSEDPGFIIRTALILTYFPGASPERVELLVTDKIEKAVQSMPELDSVVSQSKNGVSVVFVNVKESYYDIRPIWDRLRRRVIDVVGELPPDVSGPFVNDEFGDTFGTILTLTGEGFTYAELKKIADEVRDLLLRLDDVAKVEIHGAQEERVFVEYNNAQLAELGLSPVQLKSILENRNIIIPGGELFTGVERLSVEPSGNFESVDDLRRTVVQLPDRDQVVFLEDLVQISRGYIDPPSTRMRSSGVPCLGLAISLREGGNIIALGEQVMGLADRLRSQYPIGLDFDLVSFQPGIVDKKIKAFVGNVFQSVGVVLLVMLVMLGFRTGFIVASLIPSAMLMALVVMDVLNIGLDQMSLSALIIALGMLVDNAIVMAESVTVQMSAGKNRIEAAVDSARELRVPLLTSSLTTAAAFLPIYLAESTTGEYTAPLFKVVTITLLCSWVLAITMIPLLCVFGLKAPKTEVNFDSLFYRSYRAVLALVLRFRSLFLLGIAGLFVLAIGGMGRIPQIFFPPSDTPMFTAELEFPIGTAIEYNEGIVSEIEAFITSELLVSESRPEGIVNWSTYIGEGAPRFVLSYAPEQSAPNYTFMLVTATSRAVIEDIISKLDSFCLERYPDLEATIKPLPLGPVIDHPIEIRVSGDDQERLFEIVAQLKEKLEAVSGTRNVGDDWGAQTKKLIVRVNGPRARRSGVTHQDVAISLQAVLSGIETTDYREDDQVIPVTLRSAEADRDDIGKLETLNVYSQISGDSVPLSQVADLEVAWQSSRIFRRDRLKTVTVHAELEPGATASDVVSQIEPWLQDSQPGWGIGYRYDFGGEAETSGKANASIAEKLPIALLVIVLLLVGQFNSIRLPLIIMLTIPLGLIGVVFGLTVAKSYLGFMTFLGIISLSGIVINNAIVLLDRIRIEREENGLEPARAVVEASQRRLRPILLTTATTAGGLLPLWLAGSPMFVPLAISILFGLLFATVLTLGVVPVLYSLFFRVRFREFRY